MSNFTEDTSISLPGVWHGSVAWSDYNGDGKQDLLFTGWDTSNLISKLYKNTGSGFIEDTSISLPGVWHGSVAWSDYNGDGKSDFLLTGASSSGYISRLYKNTGSGFSEDTSTFLPGVSWGSVAWSDYNGDGKSDFLLTGLLTGFDHSYNRISKLYKNTGSGFIEDTSVSLPGVDFSSVAWSDYNGDGKQDFLLTGIDNSGNSISKLYKNTGSGFSEDTSISLPGVWGSSVAWSDYTGDGKPDFLLTGYTSSGNGISKLYKNTGSGFSEDTSISLPGVESSSVTWSDYTGDGKPDFLLTGDTGSGYISKLYKNTGSGFSEDTSISLPGVYGSSVAWADYNGDSKKDFLLTGDIGSGYISKLYKNTTTPVINGTANNDILIGTANAETINGLAGNDQILGLAGNDGLNGGDGNDSLDGGAGADQLKGEAGDDIYTVDNTGDIVTELASQGRDLVQSSITYTLPVNVEDLTLTGSSAINGTGNTLNNTIIGNNANNTLNGSTGADLLFGRAGNDTYIVENANDVVSEALSEGTDLIQSSVTYTLPVNVENLTLTGSAAINGTGNTLVNIITGNTANNILNGSTGADQLKGGAGNDTYVVDNAGDIVTELASQGTDLIQSSVTYTLPVEVENLTLTGTAAINGTGNTLANIITGNTANNILNGGSGADQLTGGTGDDTYVVDNVGDIVTELASAGTDLIQSSVTYTLPANVENLTLTGTTAINGTGNTLANIITGNTANNILNGSSGNDNLIGSSGADQLLGSDGNDSLSGDAANDTLTGGLGADKLIYNTNAAFTTTEVGVDSITDFTIAQTDQIVLDKTTFTTISSIAGIGFSDVSEFAKVTTDALAATSAADIVYNTATGGLFYNQNGTAAGFGTGAKFLTLTNKPVLTATQFLIQA